MFTLKQLQKYASSSHNDDEEEHIFPDVNMENDPNEGLSDVEPFNLPSEDASLEQDQDDTDPEWKLLEEEAEIEDDGNDEEKDDPITRNTIKYLGNALLLPLTCSFHTIISILYLVICNLFSQQQQ